MHGSKVLKRRINLYRWMKKMEFGETTILILEHSEKLRRKKIQGTVFVLYKGNNIMMKNNTTPELKLHNASFTRLSVSLLILASGLLILSGFRF